MNTPRTYETEFPMPLPEVGQHGQYDAEELTAHYRENWEDLYQEARNSETLVTDNLQTMLRREHEYDHRSAVGSILAHEGIELFDIPSLNVKSSGVQQIWDTRRPHIAPLYALATRDRIFSHMRGFVQMAALVELAAQISDYEPGSAFREYATQALRVQDKLEAYPPLMSCVSMVVMQVGDVVRQPIVQLPDMTPKTITATADRETREVTATESPSTMSLYSDGLNIANNLITNNRFTSQQIMYEADQWAVQIMQKMVEDTVKLGAEGLTAIAMGSAFNLDSVVKIGNTPSKRRMYRQRSLFGRGTTYENYAKIDRSSLYTDTRKDDRADAYGRDMFMGVPDRMVYEVADEVLANNRMLGVDPMTMADIYCDTAQEINTDEFIARTRSRELIWDFAYIAALKNPNEKNNRWLYTWS